MKSIPTFDELPVRADAPAESSWGVFDNEALGCLNFLTPEGVVEAARLVTTGKVFRLDARIGFAKPPLFGRQAVEHQVIALGPTAHDDMLDHYNTQEGSQWDGLGHVGHPRHRAFYNGVKATDIKDGPDGRLSIHKWADKLVGCGVLVDVSRYCAEQGRPVPPLTNAQYSLKDIQHALAAQGTQVRPGSIVLIRTGWLQAYRQASADEKRAMAPLDGLRSCGIEPSRDTVAWLWDHRVAALGTDCPAVEPWPWDFGDEGALHYRTLALLGLPIGEQFDLEALASDCAQDRCYEFMLVSAPLNLEGGIASPPNALAIK
jgi:kynurenine formamidase